MRASHSNSSALQLGIALGKLAHLNKLVWAHLIETLSSLASGPPDFHRFNSGCIAKSNMLLKGRSAKRSAGIHIAVYVPQLPVLPHEGQSDAGANRSTVTLYAD